MLRYHCRDYQCTLELAFDLIGGKWKPRVIWWLAERSRRLGELERLLPHTSRKVLVQQLRDLEGHGIIQRTVYPEVPPKVEYALTELGRKLVPILEALDAWGVHVLTEQPTEVATASLVSEP